MIKLEKNIAAVPTSLIPAYIDLFPNSRNVPIKSKTTHEKRMIVINAGYYIDTGPFNDRYKVTEIKEALVEIYKGKCAFCEQKVEQHHIEHYRPKKIYYWLAFSWDNLLLSCPTCNQYKGENFMLDGTKIVFTNTETTLRNINIISVTYDQVELPRMINPEVTDPLGKIKFELNGNIKSSEVRFNYTIETCKINRKYLNDNRRKILDQFREHVRAALVESSSANMQKAALETIFRNFIIDSKNSEMEFLAFRRYAIYNNWLSEILKELN